MSIHYTSRLSGEHKEALQELMFFNANQHRYRSAIVSSIQEFGEPYIRTEGDSLRVHTSHLGEVQTLFALEETGTTTRPIAAMTYYRTEPDTITLLHIGVDEEFDSAGPRAEELVTLKLMQRLIKTARQIKGIRRILVLYGPPDRKEIPVRV